MGLKEGQLMVEEFHRAFNLTVGETPAIRDPELRIRLLEEEVAEFAEASRDGDLVGAIKELCDICYVAFGAAVTMGIDIEPFFELVQESNMSKVGGKLREDGKMLKGPNYRPPNLIPTLEEQTDAHI